MKSDALRENTTHEHDQWLLEDAEQLMIQKYPLVHHSEWAWVGQQFDAVIDNNHSIQDLYSQIKNQVQDHLASRDVLDA